MTFARWATPESWEWTVAADVAKIVGGGTPSSKDESNFAPAGDGIPWIGPADLTGYNKAYISRGRRDLTDRGLATSGATIMPKGTVLFSSRAPIGYCAIAADEISTNQGFKSWVLEDDVLPEYVRHYLIASVGYIDSLASGTTFREVSGKRVEGVAFPLPPAAEQRRIVAKLDALTARIARARVELDRVQALAESLRVKVLREVFYWTPDELPTGWQMKRMDEVGDVQLGRQRSPKDHHGPNMRPYMRAANITWDGWDLSDVKEMNFSTDEAITFQLRDGDVLLNEGSGSAAEVGKPAVWRDQIEGACFQNTLLRVRPYEYDSELLRFALLYLALSGQFIANRKGVNIIHIGKAGLAKTIVPVPLIEAQPSLLAAIRSAFARADRLEAEAARARKLLDRLESSILAKAFRGELVPQDPNDEPAGMLLERIRRQRAAAPKAKRGRKAAA